MSIIFAKNKRLAVVVAFVVDVVDAVVVVVVVVDVDVVVVVVVDLFCQTAWLF